MYRRTTPAAAFVLGGAFDAAIRFLDRCGPRTHVFVGDDKNRPVFAFRIVKASEDNRMGVEAELELLKRQNRRLKVALFTIPVAIVVVGVIVSSLVAVRAQRLEERARAEAERGAKNG